MSNSLNSFFPRNPTEVEEKDEQIKAENRFLNAEKIKEKVPQVGVILGISIVSFFCGYILWSLFQTETFLPYQGNSFAPQTTNIIIFTALLSFIVSGVATVIGTVIYVLVWIIRKKTMDIQERYVISAYFLILLLLFLTLQLQVFRIVPIGAVILLVILVCGIVGYGRYKKLSRLKKYLGKNSPGRTREEGSKV